MAKRFGIGIASSDVHGDRTGRVALGPASIIDACGEVLVSIPGQGSGTECADLPLPSA